jgi:hypothetical protein
MSLYALLQGLLPPQSNALSSKYYKCDKYNTRQLSYAAWEFLCKTFDLYASKDTGLLVSISTYLYTYLSYIAMCVYFNKQKQSLYTIQSHVVHCK